MGSRRGLARCLRWLGGLLCASALSLGAQAATGYAAFPNGDLSSGVYLSTPDYWGCSSGPSCEYYDVANGGPFLRTYQSAPSYYAYNTVYPGDFIANGGWRGGTYTVTATFIANLGSDAQQLAVRWYDAGDQFITEHTTDAGTAHVDTLQISGSVPENASYAELRIFCVRISGSGCELRIGGISNMVIEYAALSNSAPGEGQATDVLYDPNITEALEDATQVYDFICGGGLEASAMSLIPDAWGGAGIGGQIAMVSNQLQQLCFAEAQADNAVIQTDAMVNPDTRPTIPSPAAYSDPEAAPISTQIDAFIAPQANEDDTLVTAANRTNDLLVANIRYQNAAFERAFGTGTARPAFQTEGGPLMSEANVDLDPQIDFVEGDYGQMYGKLSANIEASAVSPDAAGATDLLPLEEALDPDGACMGLNIPKPTGPVETIEDALAQLRWNSAVALSGTNMGEFLCSMVDRPERVVTEFCIGSETAMSIGGQTMAEAEPICIYGSNAPSYMNVLMGFLPTISLLLAGVGIVKMIF
jgi:hypothetical protein